MALPKLNELPSHDLIIPSTGKSVSFRPFLVKEQKVLLMALETQDEKQILKSITDTISACIADKIDINKLATFDVEYIFTQIRSKSVGETSKVSLTCSECNNPNEVTIDLNAIKIDLSNNSKIIELNEKYTLVMKYPNYTAIVNTNESQNDNLTETIFETIIMCMDELRTEEEIIRLVDEPREEIESFLDGLNNSQLESIMNFINTLPRLEHTVEYKCESCEHENKITLQGIQDFFS